jgi:hypothetical protein
MENDGATRGATKSDKKIMDKKMNGTAIGKSIATRRPNAGLRSSCP